MLDPAKLLEISQLMCEIPCNYGENFITVTFFPSMCAGHFNFQFNWKCDRGEIEFRSLDQAIEVLKKLKERVG